MLNNRDQRHGNKIGALEAAELTLGERRERINRNSTHRVFAGSASISY